MVDSFVVSLRPKTVNIFEQMCNIYRTALMKVFKSDLLGQEQPSIGSGQKKIGVEKICTNQGRKEGRSSKRDGQWSYTRIMALQWIMGQSRKNRRSQTKTHGCGQKTDFGKRERENRSQRREKCKHTVQCVVTWEIVRDEWMCMKVIGENKGSLNWKRWKNNNEKGMSTEQKNV